MKLASAIAVENDFEAAWNRCASAVVGELGQRRPASLVLVFVSSAFSEELHKIPELIKSHFPKALALGCTAQGVIGNGLEEERRPAIALIAAHLPKSKITPFRITQENLPSPDDSPDAWIDVVGVSAEDKPSFLILMDPFTSPAEEILTGLDFAFPGAPKVGGIASGGQTLGSNALFLSKYMYTEGTIGVALTGNVVLDTIVAQGCRPIGEPQRITKCQQNLLLEVDSQPPITYLQELYQRLTPRDQELLRGNLLLGIAMDPLDTLNDIAKVEYLIRNILGGDKDRGILAVAETLREGQLIQFHVRDASAAKEDLSQRIAKYVNSTNRKSLAGALLFQCNGRGAHMYGITNHDTDLFKKLAGPLPIGGFFCGGEIGPVGDNTYLHGFTSSFAIFRKPTTAHNARLGAKH